MISQKIADNGTEFFLDGVKMGTAIRREGTEDWFTEVRPGEVLWVRTAASPADTMELRFETAYTPSWTMIPAVSYHGNRCAIQDYNDVREAGLRAEKDEAEREKTSGSAGQQPEPGDAAEQPAQTREKREFPTFFAGDRDPEDGTPWRMLWHRSSVPGATYSEGRRDGTAAGNNAADRNTDSGNAAVGNSTVEASGEYDSVSMFLPEWEEGGAMSLFSENGKAVHCLLWPEQDGLPANINNVPFFGEQIREMNMIPCGYHRYYYRQQEMLEHSLMEYETIGTRGQQVKETENKLFELYKNPNLDHKPEELSKRGGAYYSDAACECINAIYNNKQTHMVVSTKNRGAIPELPEDSIVEVSCYIGAKGPMPVAWGKLPSAQRGWLQCMKAMEECTIQAAVTGNYGLALEAFTLNELIPSGENAKRVLDELLIAHKNYLPQFKSTIEKLEKENVTIKDSVVNEIIAHER